MNRNDLNEVLRKHSLWLANAEDGECADLSGATLIGADLYGVDLRQANLRGANLLGADLRHANMYGANMNDVDLCGAKLFGSILGNWVCLDNLHDYQFSRSME